MNAVAVDTREAMAEVAQSRNSIRRFVQEPLNLDDLREVIRLTGLAPSAGNVQTWRYAVVHTPEARARLAEAMTGNNKENVLSAPASVVLYSDAPEAIATLEEIMHPGLGAEEIARRAAGMRNNLLARTPEQQTEWARTQTFIALGQFVLFARGFGYDTVTMAGFDAEGIKAQLGLSDTASITSVIGFGKRAQDGFGHHRHPVERITTWH